MANTLLSPDLIAMEAMRQLENNMVLGNLVHREYRHEFVKAGDTVSIRRPVKFLASDGATLVKQDVEEGNTEIVVDQRKHIGWEFSTQDLTLSIDDYSARYIQPAMITLANEVDLSLAGLYRDVWTEVGTPGTTPATFLDLAAAGKRMDQMSVPRIDRNAVFDPEAAWTLDAPGAVADSESHLDRLVGIREAIAVSVVGEQDINHDHAARRGRLV